jgi:hypothetical protein
LGFYLVLAEFQPYYGDWFVYIHRKRFYQVRGRFTCVYKYLASSKRRKTLIYFWVWCMQLYSNIYFSNYVKNILHCNQKKKSSEKFVLKMYDYESTEIERFCATYARKFILFGNVTLWKFSKTEYCLPWTLKKIVNSSKKVLHVYFGNQYCVFSLFFYVFNPYHCMYVDKFHVPFHGLSVINWSELRWLRSWSAVTALMHICTN